MAVFDCPSKCNNGERCNICSHVFIENDVVIGDDVTIKNGVQIWDGIRIGNGVFIGPNVTFTNDKYPRSKQYLEDPLVTKVGCNASIGANATILPGITIGNGAMIGAGAVITKDVPPNALVFGESCTIKGYISDDKEKLKLDQPLKSTQSNLVDLGISGSKLYTFNKFTDSRGSLSFAEFGENLPFDPKRCFWIYDVPSNQTRGEHAHKELHEFLICVKGSITVRLDDSLNKSEVVLDNPQLGLHIPPLVWASQYNYTPDAVLFVLASDSMTPKTTLETMIPSLNSSMSEI